MGIWPFGKKEQKVVDPVCKMEISPSKAAARSEYQGKTYYFCAMGCKQSFDTEPLKYVKA